MMHKICKVLLIIGGLNWGLVGVGMLMGSDLNVVHMIFQSLPTLEAIIYILVGIAAIMKMFTCKCKKCMEACATCMAGDTTGGMDKKM
jgi:uncharacterized membrane protein YuzA (DUF378 family)